MPAKVLMVQGTSSSVGKSLLVAALCRIFARQGLRVAPFKAQNMSNNAAVCADGAEIGRAQAVQAAAANIAPTADMNPVLLKPEGNARSQVIKFGRPWRTLSARDYYRCKEELWPAVTGALERLRSTYDLVMIEGAGSPVELNLRSLDIVNMAIARHVRAPVLLVGDIDRGGIFAQLLGTLWLLPPEERALVRGLVVNKFRGDLALFADGVRILEERGGMAVLGVVPYLPALAVPEEDAVALDNAVVPAKAAIDIAVIQLPHIANFDDFDPLRAEPGVGLRYVRSPDALGTPHAVILPGTKSTRADLAWLRTQGFVERICALASNRTSIVGICGGYQMLGRKLRDPRHIESSDGEATGLALLPVDTDFETAKATFQVRARVLGGPGWLGTAAGQEVEGYEIHMGRTTAARPWLEITHRNGAVVGLTDGTANGDGRIWGCYLHGLFANAGFRRLWLASLPPLWKDTTGPQADGPTGTASLDAALDRLADAVEAALDMNRLAAILE
jgi:adenosylcobyric acid synthase